MDLWVLEAAGLDPTNPFDTGSVTSNQPASTTVTAPPVMPSSPSALVVSTACSCGDITGLAMQSPFTPTTVQTGETTSYLFAKTTGSYGAVWSAKSGTWNASTVAFK